MTASYPVRSRLCSPHPLRAKPRRLPLHPLLKLDVSGKGRRLPISYLRVREMLRLKLLLDQPEVLSSMSRKPRSGRVLRPPFKLHRRGSLSFCWTRSLSFCWTASLCLRLLVCGCGRKARGAILLKPWPWASFCPMMYMPLKKGRRSLWGIGYSGISSR